MNLEFKGSSPCQIRRRLQIPLHFPRILSLRGVSVRRWQRAAREKKEWVCYEYMNATAAGLMIS